MTTSTRCTRRNHRARGAFTLLELLIVIVIISLLITISLAVGSKVLNGGRETLTTSITRAMETSLTSYITDAGDKVPSPLVEHPASSGSITWQPVSDVRQGDRYDDDMVNSVGWYVFQMKDVSSVASTVSGLPTKVVKPYAPRLDASGMPPGSFGQPLLPTVFDGWGRPLRYVHPALDGVIHGDPSKLDSTDDGNGVDMHALISIGSGENFTFDTVRRNRTTKVAGGNTSVADGDGGLCPNNRPYFYSAGADGDPSTIADNVYSTNPTYQSE